MNMTPGTSKDADDNLVRGIKRKTRKHYSAEEKMWIVLADLRGEESISALCRREGITESCTIPGRRSSWRLARPGFQVTRRDRRRHPRSKSCGRSPLP